MSSATQMTQLQHPMLTTQICFNTKYYTDHHISPLKMWKQATGKARHPAGMPVLLLFQIVSPDKWDISCREGPPVIFYILLCPECIYGNNGKKQRWEERDYLLCLAHWAVRRHKWPQRGLIYLLASHAEAVTGSDSSSVIIDGFW